MPMTDNSAHSAHDVGRYDLNDRMVTKQGKVESRCRGRSFWSDGALV